MATWAYRRGVRLGFIRTGGLVENGCIEIFNGKFQDGCRNENWLISLDDVRRRVAADRVDHNEAGPHNPLDNRASGESARSRTGMASAAAQ
jgi:putative transposase